MIGISVHDTTLGTTIGNLGMTETVFPHPVFHGDTIRVETEVVSVESKSRNDRGIVEFEHRAYNQDGTLVARCVRQAMIMKKRCLTMRSLLFVPGDSTRKLEKSLQSGADVLLIDLEDSVSADRKQEARKIAAGFIAEARRPDGPRLFVRVNDLSGDMTEDDLAAVMPAGPDGIMLPKSNGGSDVALLAVKLRVHEAMAGTEDGATAILPIITETAAGVFAASTYTAATPRLAGITWGAEDLSAAIGAHATRTDDGVYTDVFRMARAITILAASNAGVAAVDTVFRISVTWTVSQDCLKARRSPRAYIHPAGAVINEVFTPIRGGRARPFGGFAFEDVQSRRRRSAARCMIAASARAAAPRPRQRTRPGGRFRHLPFVSASRANAGVKGTAGCPDPEFSILNLVPEIDAIPLTFFQRGRRIANALTPTCSPAAEAGEIARFSDVEQAVDEHIVVDVHADNLACEDVGFRRPAVEPGGPVDVCHLAFERGIGLRDAWRGDDPARRLGQSGDAEFVHATRRVDRCLVHLFCEFATNQIGHDSRLGGEGEAVLDPLTRSRP